MKLSKSFLAFAQSGKKAALNETVQKLRLDGLLFNAQNCRNHLLIHEFCDKLSPLICSIAISNWLAMDKLLISSICAVSEEEERRP